MFKLIMLFLIIICIFMSKGLFNLFVGIILIYSLYIFFVKRIFLKEKVFYCYLFLFPLGLIINFFSNGIDGSINFFSNERELLYIFIFLSLNLTLVEYKKLEIAIFIGGLTSAFYSAISVFVPKFLGIKTLYYDYQKNNKMQSFQNGLRWARLLNIMTIFSIFKYEKKGKIYEKITIIGLLVFFLWNIVINGQRAAILSSLIGLLTFFLLYVFSMKKDRLTYIFTIVILTILLGISVTKNDKMIKIRVQSIFDLNNNISNKVRIGYLKVGTDILKENLFLGVGSGNIGDWKVDGAFKEFIEIKSSKYKNKYAKYHEGAPFENSYLNMAVENGVIYAILYIIMQFIIAFKIFKGILKNKYKNQKIRLMVIFSIIVSDRFFVFFYPGTDAYVEFLIAFLMFYGIKMTKEENN